MLDRLYLSRSPFRLPWLPLHARCATKGQALFLRLGPAQPAYLSVAVGQMDPPCVKAFEEPRERQPQRFFALTVYAPAGKSAVWMRVEGERVRIPPGSYLVVNPKESARFEVGQSLSIVWIAVSQLMLRQCRDAIQVPKTAGPFDFARKVQSASPGFRAILQDLKGYAAQPAHVEQDVWLPLLARQAAVRLLATLWHEHPNGLRNRSNAVWARFLEDACLQLAVQYLRDHLAEPFQSVHLAKQVGMSRAQLYRLFQREWECSPERFLRQSRVERAEQLLKQTPRARWQEVAEAVGFQSAQALREACQAVLGRLPSAV